MSSTREVAVEHLQALAIVFSAVTLSVMQFARHATPSPDIVRMTPSIVVPVLLLLILMPALAIFAADRWLALRDPSGKRVKRLRTIVFAVAIVMMARQLFLYFDPASDVLASNGAVAVLAGLGAIGAAAWLAVRAFEHCRQFFLWMAVPALFMTFIVFVQTSFSPPPAGYATETPARGDAPPVFVFVFDEMSYQVLADGDTIDAESYPNLAELAGDGAWFTNATTNYFHTTFVVPKLFDGVTELTDEYQVREYSQYGYVESLLFDGCGSEYTCRGQGYLARENRASLIGDMLVRTAYQAAPGPLDRALDVPAAWVTDKLGTPRPTVDRLGMHTFTDELWAEFIGDVGARESRGRAYFVHILLPHDPYIYGPDGNVATDDRNIDFASADIDEDEAYENYRLQAQYVDALVGDFTRLLKAENLYDDATIVVTGDHGLRRYSLDDGPPMEVTDEVAKVPLIIKAPGVRPQVSDAEYQHVDFAATLLDVLGREAPAGKAGVSAFAEERPQRDKVLYVDEQNRRYWEYVLRPQSGEWEVVREVEGELPESPRFVAVRANAGD